jgi:hypothetical protein
MVIQGRVAPLISVGVGFHPEMSGRENVFVNGMLLGLTRSEVERRLKEIVAFSELEDFIDTPVKFYSSGMFMRLGFSVAAHVEPNILLVDEILAVGDLAFQLKCIDRMRDLQRNGTTIVIVSHSLHHVRLLCPRTLLMSHGRLEFDGPTETAISRHQELLTADTREPYSESDGGVSGGMSDTAEMVSRELIGPFGPTNQPRQEDELIYRVTLKLKKPLQSPHVFFHVMADIGVPVYGMVTAVRRQWRDFETGDLLDVEIAFRPRLCGGSYRLVLVLTDREARQALWVDRPGMLIYIHNRPGSTGYSDLDAEIRVDGVVLTDHDDQLLDGREPVPESAFLGSASSLTLAGLGGEGSANPNATTAPLEEPS